MVIEWFIQKWLYNRKLSHLEERAVSQFEQSLLRFFERYAEGYIPDVNP